MSFTVSELSKKLTVNKNLYNSIMESWKQYTKNLEREGLAPQGKSMQDVVNRINALNGEIESALYKSHAEEWNTQYKSLMMNAKVHGELPK